MKINEIIVVEGKTDTNKLQSILEVDTIETGGSIISKETLERIKIANEKRGVIIFTDPDFPGQKIRQTIIDYIPTCKHAFVAKNDAIKGRKVGIAEASNQAIIEALNQVVTLSREKQTLSYNDFIKLGLYGNKELRLKVYDYFHLGYGNTKTLFKRMNMMQITYEEACQALKEIL